MVSLGIEQKIGGNCLLLLPHCCSGASAAFLMVKWAWLHEIFANSLIWDFARVFPV